MKYKNEDIDGDCPICKSNKGLLLYEVNCLQSTRHFRLERPNIYKYIQLKDHIKTLWKKDYCQIIKCKECNFSYAYPFVAGDQKFYNLAFEHGGYPNWKYEFQKSYNTVEKLLINKKYVASALEIGAGNGAFLSKVSPKFFNPKNVYATEYSDPGIVALKSNGFNTINSDFRLLNQESFSSLFDFVFMHQILEHLDDINKTFEVISSITKPAAHLFIAVPNSHRIEFNELNDGLLDMPPNHIGRWTKKTFETVAIMYNWDICDYEIEKTDLEEVANQFSHYKYFRNTQRKYSLENLVETNNQRIINNRFYSLKRGILNFHKLNSKKKIMAHHRKLGGCQWVHMQKKQDLSFK